MFCVLKYFINDNNRLTLNSDVWIAESNWGAPLDDNSVFESNIIS